MLDRDHIFLTPERDSWSEKGYFLLFWDFYRSCNKNTKITSKSYLFYGLEENKIITVREYLVFSMGGPLGSKSSSLGFWNYSCMPWDGDPGEATQLL